MPPTGEPKWHPDRDGYLVAKTTLWGRPMRISKHRWVMSHALGRYLLPDEIVHHINGNRTDNRLANLELRTTATHPPGQSVFEMLDFSIAYIADHIEDARRLGYTRR